MQNDIIICARSWVGTRFHHQGRLKKTSSHKGGVDCLGLLLGVASELGLRAKNGLPFSFYDEVDYSHTPNTAQLKAKLDALLFSVAITQISAGDIVLLNVADSPQHLGIVGHPADCSAIEQDLSQMEKDSAPAQCALQNDRGFTLIHAYAPARAVVEHGLDEAWKNRIVAVYRVTSSPT